MMTVTGRVSQNPLTLQRLLDRAFSRAGVPIQTITAEYIDTARELLQLTLSEFVTTGVSLWTNGVSYMGMRAGMPSVILPDGTLEVDRVVVLTTEVTAASLGGSGSTWTAEADEAVAVQFIGIRVSTAGFYDVAVDVSAEGVSYTEIATYPDVQLFANQWNWIEIVPATDEAAYFRVRETSDADLPLTDVQFAVGKSERSLTPIGQDTYATLPGKRNKGTVSSYYTDRRVDGPVIYLWSPPDEAHENYILSVWRKRHMIDVGAMTDRIEVPQRWMDAVIWDLAWRLCAEIPEAARQIQEVKMFADLARAKIAPSESDGGNVSFAPDIGMYTA